jgi:2,3-dihydroxybiphenyl 1,2-dioxygenase
MTGVIELGYVRIGVSDLEAWRTFASDGLGMEVAQDSNEEAMFLRIDQWHHRVILEPDGSDDLLGIGLRVAGAGEFRDMQANFKERGVSFEVADVALARKRCVLELMLLKDPSGNPLEIFHGPRIDTHLPFHPGRGMFGKFVTGKGGLGHMIVAHNGLEQAHEFYTALGMRGGIEYLMQSPDGNPMELMFMHCNERDHSLAFGMAPQGRINHIMFEVDNLDDVLFTYERIKDNYHVAVTPGKHANDQMFSFYCISPSSFMVEIGYGARPATHESEYFVQDTYGHQFNPGA